MDESSAHTFIPDRWGAALIPAAGYPTAGHRTALDVVVGVGCCAEIRGDVPTVARSPRGVDREWSPSEGPTSLAEVTVRVESDGVLAWRPGHGVAEPGTNHGCDTLVELAGSSRLLWFDEFVLDHPHHPNPGTWTSRLRVTRDGWPVSASELGVGPDAHLWASAAVLERASAACLTVLIDPEAPSGSWRSLRTSYGSAIAAALPLAAPGIRLVAWGDVLADCRAAIDELLPACGAANWAVTRGSTRILPVFSG
jgi:urease accessory protein UreH